MALELRRAHSWFSFSAWDYNSGRPLIPRQDTSLLLSLSWYLGHLGGHRQTAKSCIHDNHRISSFPMVPMLFFRTLIKSSSSQHFVTYYRFWKPAFPPRPNRTLGGVNCSADTASDSPSISTSRCWVWPAAAPVEASPSVEAPSSTVFVLMREARRESFVAMLDLRRRWPPSSNIDRRPSTPSRVTAKK